MASWTSIEYRDERDALAITSYSNPRTRTGQGDLQEKALLGKYQYEYKGKMFVVYLVDGRDGMGSYPNDRFFFVLHSEKSTIHSLVFDAGRWTKNYMTKFGVSTRATGKRVRICSIAFAVHLGQTSY